MGIEVISVRFEARCELCGLERLFIVPFSGEAWSVRSTLEVLADEGWTGQPNPDAAGPGVLKVRCGVCYDEEAFAMAGAADMEDPHGLE